MTRPPFRHDSPNYTQPLGINYPYNTLSHGWLSNTLEKHGGTIVRNTNKAAIVIVCLHTLVTGYCLAQSKFQLNKAVGHFGPLAM